MQSKALSSNAFTESKVTYYYDNIKFKNLNFEFSETSPEIILSILKGLNPSKAAGIDNLSDKYLKDGDDILARPICQLFNLSIKLNSPPRVNSPPKLTLKTTAPFHFSPSHQKLLEGLFMTKPKSFLVKTNFSTDFNLVSKKTIPLTLVLDI